MWWNDCHSRTLTYKYECVLLFQNFSRSKGKDSPSPSRSPNSITPCRDNRKTKQSKWSKHQRLITIREGRGEWRVKVVANVRCNRKYINAELPSIKTKTRSPKLKTLLTCFGNSCSRICLPSLSACSASGLQKLKFNATVCQARGMPSPLHLVHVHTNLYKSYNSPHYEDWTGSGWVGVKIVTQWLVWNKTSTVKESNIKRTSPTRQREHVNSNLANGVWPFRSDYQTLCILAYYVSSQLWVFLLSQVSKPFRPNTKRIMTWASATETSHQHPFMKLVIPQSYTMVSIPQSELRYPAGHR